MLSIWRLLMKKTLLSSNWQKRSCNLSPIGMRNCKMKTQNYRKKMPYWKMIRKYLHRKENRWLRWLLKVKLMLKRLISCMISKRHQRNNMKNLMLKSLCWLLKSWPKRKNLIESTMTLESWRKNIRNKESISIYSWTKSPKQTNKMPNTEPLSSTMKRNLVKSLLR